MTKAGSLDLKIVFINAIARSDLNTIKRIYYVHGDITASSCSYYDSYMGQFTCMNMCATCTLAAAIRANNIEIIWWMLNMCQKKANISVVFTVAIIAKKLDIAKHLAQQHPIILSDSLVISMYCTCSDITNCIKMLESCDVRIDNKSIFYKILTTPRYALNIYIAKELHELYDMNCQIEEIFRIACLNNYIMAAKWLFSIKNLYEHLDTLLLEVYISNRTYKLSGIIEWFFSVKNIDLDKLEEQCPGIKNDPIIIAEKIKSAQLHTQFFNNAQETCNCTSKNEEACTAKFALVITGPNIFIGFT